MQPGAAGELRQQEVPGKGQEDAKAENLKRVLSAQDQRPQPGRLQSSPVLGQKADRDGSQRQEMREAEHVESGLSVPIRPPLDPARYHMAELGEVPGQGDEEREQQVGDRNP